MSNETAAWDGMNTPERIVAMSLVAGSVIAIVNAVVWAFATCYISNQRAQVQLAQAQAAAYGYDRLPTADAQEPTAMEAPRG